MKQITMFSEDCPKQEQKYTTKIKAPVYEPRGIKPHIMELCDTYKTTHLIREIEQSNVTLEEKKFLIEASRRHTVFNYEKIADYYANATVEMQNLMERSALVIIDFEKAIQYGYVKLAEEIGKGYLQEYGE